MIGRRLCMPAQPGPLDPVEAPEMGLPRPTTRRLMVEVAVLAVLFSIFIPRAAKWPHREFWRHMAAHHAERASYCDERAESCREGDTLRLDFQRLADWHRKRKEACESAWVRDRQEELETYEKQFVREFALLERLEQRRKTSPLEPDS
jgi:hypothetical protein